MAATPLLGSGLAGCPTRQAGLLLSRFCSPHPCRVAQVETMPSFTGGQVVLLQHPGRRGTAVRGCSGNGRKSVSRGKGQASAWMCPALHPPGSCEQVVHTQGTVSLGLEYCDAPPLSSARQPSLPCASLLTPHFARSEDFPTTAEDTHQAPRGVLLSRWSASLVLTISHFESPPCSTSFIKPSPPPPKLKLIAS